jgi:UDP-N-acetylmuramate dehydrogenase
MKRLLSLGSWIEREGLGVFALNQPLSPMTSWRIGGLAEGFCAPFTLAACERILGRCEKEQTPVTVLGQGTNVLISDRGLPGLALSTRKLRGIRMEGTRIRAEAGVSLGRLASVTAGLGLTGLEFAAGIPGTVGGAAVMNAGAHGGEMKDVVQSAVVWSGGVTREWAASDMGFEYRGSRLRGGGAVVLEVCLGLIKGNRAESLRVIERWRRERRKKQPLKRPNGGSVFKNPKNHGAGWYIEQAGLKGFTVGGAQISEKHANFIVNLGGAKAADVLMLMEQAQQTVLTKFGVHLETEVVLLGFDDCGR